MFVCLQNSNMLPLTNGTLRAVHAMDERVQKLTHPLLYISRCCLYRNIFARSANEITCDSFHKRHIDLCLQTITSQTIRGRKWGVERESERDM